MLTIFLDVPKDEELRNNKPNMIMFMILNAVYSMVMLYCFSMGTKNLADGGNLSDANVGGLFVAAILIILLMVWTSSIYSISSSRYYSLTL